MVVSVAREKAPQPDHARLLAAFEAQERDFLRLAADDERAFGAVMAALRLAKDDAARPAALELALAGAADVPLRAAAACVCLLETLREAEPHASRAIVSDIGAAAHLALACLSSSLLNVLINERSIKDRALQSRLASQSEKLRTEGERAHGALTARVAERLAPRP
jgi:formiminotetrahydrofolate cyclodeaminase